MGKLPRHLEKPTTRRVDPQKRKLEARQQEQIDEFYEREATRQQAERRRNECLDEEKVLDELGKSEFDFEKYRYLVINYLMKAPTMPEDGPHGREAWLVHE